MKKILVVLLVLVMSVTAVGLFGCNNGPKSDVKVIVPDGAPALAIVSLFEKDELAGHKMSYEIVSGDAIVQKVSSGDANVAIMPTNAAANLYNKGVDIKLVATEVQGILYMVGTSTITDYNALKGKVVYSIGQGNTPEFVFKYLLTQNGIAADDIVEGNVATDGKVTISYQSDGSAIIPLLVQGTAEYAILGEPAATTAKSKKATLVTTLDLQAEWAKLNDSASYPQASLVVSGELAKDKTFVNALVKALKENDQWIVNNVDKVNELLQTKNSTLKNLTKEVIESCNIKTVEAKNAKTAVNAYLTVLNGFKPAFIGGKIPSEEFFLN